ncbi:unnamed protein product [marine sediment metagenome]|uniref:SAP domain-containing protein n=1 Tax=marine sediment metagenome TaxID=412755 RepID=X1L0J5_9ZZZZ
MKKKYEKELEKLSQGPLVRMCEGKGLPHTGDKDALIARLVAFEEAKATEPPPEPEGEPPEPGPSAASPEPEPEPEAPPPED